MTLSEEHKGRKLFFTILLLAVGFFFLGRGIYAGLNHRGGWIEIEVQSGVPGCGGSFEFQYCLDDRNGNAEFHDLTLLYTSLCSREDKLYSSTEEEAELGNLCALNRQPNREVRLEKELYRALEEVQASGNRVIYLAPLYEYYSCLFFCEREEETLEYDPLRNPELEESFSRLAAFARDPAQIDVELLGNDTARLKVSREYLDYAAENGITVFVDFGWMKNAFILDDLAAAVRDAGFHRGYLQSVDGFGCNLCDSGESFALNILDRACPGDRVVAQMTYERPLSFLSLHSSTNAPAGNDLYFEMENGEVRSIYVDPADGMPKTALDDLLVWSERRGCGELALEAGAIFAADRFDRGALDALDCSYVFCSDGVICCNDPSVRFPLIAEGYRLEQTG